MSYTATLPSNRPGFAGLLGRAESIMESRGVKPPEEGSSESINLRYKGITMPAIVCANADGVGPGMYRPWVGAKKDEATMIQADLQIGIIGTATSNRDGSRWLSLRLKNFQKPTSEGMPGMGIEVGRPISEHTTFGTDMMYEAYRSLTSRALVLGEETLKYEIEVDATSLGAFPLPMSGNLRLPIERQPAYLLGSTCLLAAERTNRPVEVV